MGFRPPLLPSAPCLDGEERSHILPPSPYQQGLYEKVHELDCTRNFLTESYAGPVMRVLENLCIIHCNNLKLNLK
jgi:hypothetical protein